MKNSPGVLDALICVASSLVAETKEFQRVIDGQMFNRNRMITLTWVSYINTIVHGDLIKGLTEQRSLYLIIQNYSADESTLLIVGLMVVSDALN